MFDFIKFLKPQKQSMPSYKNIFHLAGHHLNNVFIKYSKVSIKTKSKVL